jgi:hypothetical protein
MSAALFALGVWVSMRLVAALYRIVDLWYTIGTRWLGVSVGIVAWGAVTVAVALLLGGHERATFLTGLVSFLVFYPTVYLLRNLAVRKPPG